MHKKLYYYLIFQKLFYTRCYRKLKNQMYIIDNKNLRHILVCFDIFKGVQECLISISDIKIKLLIFSNTKSIKKQNTN